MDLKKLLESDNDVDFDLGKEIFNEKFKKHKVEKRFDFLKGCTKFYYICIDKRLRARFINKKYNK